MAAYTKDGSQAPDIVYTQQFKTANVDFLKYTDRDEAVDVDNDFNLDLNDSSDQTNVQYDADEDLAGYLGYMDRAAATRVEDGLDDRYPTFDAETFNMDENEHDKLVQNLRRATKSKSMMWQGVVSFDTAFLDRTGTRDPKTGHIDQRKIKAAIQGAMPRLLHEEQLDSNSTFWWGDVHLNKEHTHVHLAISQVRNSRPIKSDGRPKGSFKVKSFQHFKSHIYHSLEEDRELGRDIDLEKQVDVLKKGLLTRLRSDAEAASKKTILDRIYRSLPNYKDKRRWRASNHSKEFRSASKLTSELVENLLKSDLQQDYDELIGLYRKQDVLSREKYGQKIKDTVAPKDKRLREQLMNRIFDSLREVRPEETKADLLAAIQADGIAGNLKAIDQKKVELKSLNERSQQAISIRKELGLRRNFIRVENLKLRKQVLLEKIETINKLGGDSEVIRSFTADLLDQVRFSQLSMLASWERRKQPAEDRQFKRLRMVYVDPLQLKIEKASEDALLPAINRLEELRALILKNPHDPVVLAMVPNPKSSSPILNADKYYQAQINVLRLKIAINSNNKVFDDDPSLMRDKNRPLFQQLKQNYAYLNDSQLIDKRVDVDIEQLQVMTERSFQHHLGNGTRLTLNGINRALSSIKSGARKDVAAMKKIGRDDELERLDLEDEMPIDPGDEIER